MSHQDLSSIPALNSHFRLQWEPAQESHVLLYPEGMVQLNGPAAEILTRVDGKRSLADIIEDLQRTFPDADSIQQDVLEFVDKAHEQHWISL